MKVTVRCFASVRELLGQDQLEVELPDGATLAMLKAELALRAPQLARLPLAHAVNRAYCKPDRVLVDGDEVAFIPPISGGQPDDVCFELRHAELDPRELELTVRTDHDGALVTFVGVTRDHHDGQRVRGLSYEAYEEMASEVATRILREVRAQFEVGRVAVLHRLGDVPIGAASIVVVVAAAHRGPAFDACRRVMDRIKAEVPIFKREWLADEAGGSRWVGELPRVPEAD